MKFEKPFFYSNKFALRFEIGPPEEGVWDEQYSKLNERYFAIALERALAVYHTAFEENDSISIIYQMYSAGRQKIKRRNSLFGLIRNIEDKPITFSKHRAFNAEEFSYKCEHWHRAVVSGLSKVEIDITSLFKWQINTDFGSREQALKGNCFIINDSKSLALHLYDDRGMDVIATEKAPLERLYKEQNALLLDHDRERMDAMFAKG